MRLKSTRLGIVLLLPMITACNWLTPLVFFTEQKKKVSPEFDKLGGKKVAIVVWTPPEVLFDYPFARLELSTYVGEKLAGEMPVRDTAVDLVDPRDVEDFLQKNPRLQIDPRRVGEHFEADYVVYLELITFQIRDAQHPQFLRGRVEASVRVHDVKADPDLGRVYDLQPVSTTYPPDSPVTMSASNSQLVREQTYRMFAEQVARKFYEHTIDVS